MSNCGASGAALGVRQVLRTMVASSASKVAKLKAEERDYQVLADLNFRPRTTYTAGVINPHPELA